MKVIGVDPGKSGAIFFFETDPEDRRTHANWFAHEFEWKPWRVVTVPLIVPPSILTWKKDKKGRRKRKQPKSSIDFDQLAVDFAKAMKECDKPPHMAFLEQVAAMPGQGTASMFNFGAVYGFMRGMILGHGIPVMLVRPQVWKAELKIPKNKTEDKEYSRKLASKFFPSAKDQWTLAKEDGVAESALIAQYGMQILGADL